MFTDHKITAYQDNIKALSNTPSDDGVTAEQLKALFDGRTDREIKDSINGIITELLAITASEQIGAQTISGVAGSTVQALMVSLKGLIDSCYTREQSDTALTQQTKDLVKDVSVDLDTGVITVTKKDGSSKSFDTALEKVPAAFELVEHDNGVFLKITNVDGSASETNVTALLNIYSFTNTDELSFSVSDSGSVKTISAQIRDAAVGMNKLDPDVITFFNTIEANAQAAAGNAADAKNAANTSAQEALEYKNTAQSSAQSAKNASDSANSSAENAVQSAENASQSAADANSAAVIAESWAVGGTGERQGEDVNNAKYWAGIAQDAAGGGVSSFNGRSGAVMPQSGDYTAAQTGAVPVGRTVNGKALSGDITLTSGDIGADTAGTAAAAVGAHNDAADAHGSLFAGKADAPITSTATLLSDGWSDKTQTVSISGMTADSTVLVAPAPSSQEAYTASGIICSAQGEGTITFTCTDIPSDDLSVNVVILG